MTVATIGSKIRKIREIKGIKQEVMAERLDITQQSYSNIEADKIDVAFSKIEKIAEIFGMTVSDIACFDEKVIFNNFASNQANQAYIINVVSEKERELYEKTIALLEQRIKDLESK